LGGNVLSLGTHQCHIACVNDLYILLLPVMLSPQKVDTKFPKH
jgi:hypothetical protein